MKYKRLVLSILKLNMIVYIEQVIIDNMVVNYFLLWFCSLVLKEKKSKIRFVLASAVGVIFAFIFPLFEINTILLFLLKTVLCIMIILIAFPYKNLKNLLVLCTCFFISTFLLGGVVIGLIFNYFIDYEITNGTFSYVSNIPVGIFILIGFLLFKLVYDIVFISKNKIKLEKMKFELTVYFSNKTTTITAFLDTGNLLFDSKTGLPVIIINFKAFKEILNIKTEQFLLGNYKIENSRYSNLSTANQSSKILLFDVDKVCIKLDNQMKVIPNAVLGLALNNFSKKLNCDALIGLNLIELEK